MSRSELSQDDLRALRDLPPEEPPALLRERVRQRALAELAASAARSSRQGSARLLARVALPGALAATVVVYLSWAVTVAGGLYRR